MWFQQPICLLYRLRVIATLSCGMATAFKLLQKAMHGKGMKATMLAGNDQSFIPRVCNMLALDKTQILEMNKKQTKPKTMYMRVEDMVEVKSKTCN